jgi:hypothetical protein
VRRHRGGVHWHVGDSGVNPVPDGDEVVASVQQAQVAVATGDAVPVFRRRVPSHFDPSVRFRRGQILQNRADAPGTTVLISPFPVPPSANRGAPAHVDASEFGVTGQSNRNRRCAA